MSENDFGLGWGDEEEPETAAATLTAVDTTRDQQRQRAQAKLIAEQVGAAVEAARPGLDKIPDPVKPAGEGALTEDEEERFRLVNEGIDLGNLTWFIQGKCLDTAAVGRLFRATPHKLEPERCYETIEEWAELEKGISVSQCSKLRAAWEIGSDLAVHGYNSNPGQVREIVPVKNAHGIKTAVALYVLVADAVGADKVTAARLRDTVKMLPGELQLDEDEDVDVLAMTLKGVLVEERQSEATRAIPAVVTQAVSKRTVELADILDRKRIPRSEVQLHLLRAFADPDDRTVFDAVLKRMKQEGEKE